MHILYARTQVFEKGIQFSSTRNYKEEKCWHTQTETKFKTKRGKRGDKKSRIKRRKKKPKKYITRGSIPNRIEIGAEVCLVFLVWKELDQKSASYGRCVTSNRTGLLNDSGDFGTVVTGPGPCARLTSKKNQEKKKNRREFNENFGITTARRRKENEINNFYTRQEEPLRFFSLVFISICFFVVGACSKDMSIYLCLCLYSFCLSWRGA